MFLGMTSSDLHIIPAICYTPHPSYQGIRFHRPVSYPIHRECNLNPICRMKLTFYLSNFRFSYPNQKFHTFAKYVFVVSQVVSHVFFVLWVYRFFQVSYNSPTNANNILKGRIRPDNCI